MPGASTVVCPAVFEPAIPTVDPVVKTTPESNDNQLWVYPEAPVKIPDCWLFPK